MSLSYPFGPQHIAHLAPGTLVKALITSVHDRYLLKFTMRIVNISEFELTDVIELSSSHTFLGYNVLPLPMEGMFGLGINQKVYRAILMSSLHTRISPSAYLIDVGIIMPIQPWDPIYSLSPLVQSIPGKAIACIYADYIDPFKQIERWRFVQEHLREDLVVILKVVYKFDTVLHVLFADDPYYDKNYSGSSSSSSNSSLQKQQHRTPSTITSTDSTERAVNEYYT